MSGTTVYIVLFRGVGGATQLPMAKLREKLAEAGFENAGTYINSGNAYLKTDMPRGEMLKIVADICKNEFGFDKAILALSLAEWRKLIRDNPFPEGEKDGKTLHVFALDRVPAAENIAKLEELATGRERLKVVGKVLYLHLPDGFGTSKLAVRADKVIGVTATARNWNTVVRLRELAEAATK
ncbi:MAG: DUF1697 domain-containing protein [Hyphomicrobiales bacterium]|nr:DUF1697 domain-containing protein [Hyphomicrobiales bacterium]